MIPTNLRRISYNKDGEILLKQDYFYQLTLEDIAKLCRDFQADCFDGFVSNDNAYIELKLKEME